MGKVPVGETIRRAYAFAFGRYFTILGILWAPMLLLIVAGYFVVVPLFETFTNIMQAAVQHPQDQAARFAMMQQMQYLTPRIWGFDLLELAVFAVITVGIVKEAFGLRKGFRPVYLWFGLEELLVAAALLFFVFIFFAFEVAALIVGAVVVGSTVAVAQAKGTASAALIGSLTGLLVVTALGALLYISVRLMFFVGPVTVAERDFGPLRSWQLSKGNFWRILAVLFVTWVPIFFVIYGLFFGVVGATMFGPLWKIAQAHPKGDPAAAAQALATMITGLKQIWPYLLAIWIVPLPVLNGLIFSPAVFAYRALIPEAPAPAAEPPVAA